MSYALYPTRLCEAPGSRRFDGTPGCSWFATAATHEAPAGQARCGFHDRPEATASDGVFDDLRADAAREGEPTLGRYVGWMHAGDAPEVEGGVEVRAWPRREPQEPRGDR